MPDHPSTAVARNSNTFLPVNLFGLPSFGFLEAAQRLFDSPARASMKCEEFMEATSWSSALNFPASILKAGSKCLSPMGVLTIQATREERKEEKNPDSYRSEFSYGELRRSLALPQDANVDGITASYKDEVLEVRVLAPEKPATDTTPVSSP